MKSPETVTFPAPTRGPFRSERWPLWLIAALGLLLVFFVVTKSRYVGDNVRSRLITVERLLEAGTLAHATPGDSTPFDLSIDRVKVGEAIYSSKPPNYPLLMAAEAYPIRLLTGWNFYEHQVDYIRLLTVLNQVLPYIGLLCVAFLWMWEFTRDRFTLVFMLLALSIGILPYAYAATINNHTVSAVLFFLGFYLVYQIRHRGEGRLWIYGLLGLMTGFAVSIELPAGVYALLFGGLLLGKSWKGTAVFAVCALVATLPGMYANYLITGTMKPVYLQPDLYRFEGSYWNAPTGKDLLHEPKWLYALKGFFGSNGLFTVNPVLLLGAVALGGWWLGRKSPLRWEAVGFLVATLALVAFIVMRTWNYGGHAIGMRWYICFMPILMFFAFPLVEKLSQSWGGRMLCLLLLAASLPWNFQALDQTPFMNGWLEQIFHDLLG